MTLMVARLLQGLLLQMKFVEHLLNILHGFNWHIASRGSSPTAELLVEDDVEHVKLL